MLEITAQQNENGEWILVDENGDEVQEGYGYESQEDAMDAAAMLWPANSVWHGKPTDTGGWLIDND